jgi:hypothetical protein
LLEGKTALQLLQNDTERGSIITFSPLIDEMLGGGVPLGRLTEFCMLHHQLKADLDQRRWSARHWKDSNGVRRFVFQYSMVFKESNWQ